MIKVAVLTNIISPYRIPFFNYLNKDEEIVLKVFYVAEQGPNRSWKTYYNEIGYSYEILRGIHIEAFKTIIHLNIRSFRALNKYSPDIIVIGTGILNTPISLVAMLYAKLKNIPAIRYESNHEYVVSQSRLKKMIYKYYYFLFDYFFVYSGLTQKYLMALGINSEKIKIGYNVGDTDFFGLHTNDYIQTESFTDVRNKYPCVMLLYAGRLQSRKNVLGLLDCLLSLDPHDVGLYILGNGPLEKGIAEKITEFRNVKVFLEGFRHKEEAIKYFSLADILVVPSLRDHASIVLSEGLSSGLFTIGSKYDGSAENFIRHKENGFIIDPRDEMEFKECLEKAIHMARNGLIDKDRIRATMKEYTVSAYAERLVEIIKELNQAS